MPDEVDGVSLQSELLEHLLRRFVTIYALVGFGVALFEVLNSLQELLEPPLLEHAHEIGG